MARVERHESRTPTSAVSPPDPVPSDPATSRHQVFGVLLVMTMAVLVVAQWELVPEDLVGRTNSVRDTGLAIVVGLVGFRACLTDSRHLFSGGLAALPGFLLLLQGFVATHHSAGLQAVEVVCGVMGVLAGAVLAGTQPRRR